MTAPPRREETDAMSKPAFEVDKAGLAKLLERRGKSFAVLELIQNCLDEEVTRVTVELIQTAGSRGYHTLTVTDDCPEGFADLSHAYTLFAESKKKDNAEQRGRFNLGEKLVLAICRRAEIRTTTGVIRFEGDRRSHGRSKTDKGSVFEGELKMTQAEAAKALEAVRTVIVPAGIELVVNGEPVALRESVRSVQTTLPTEIADAEGYLRRSTRQTIIHIYEPHEGEAPMLYELGIPVVEIDCPWHVDIQQKVPLNTDRDNVTPGYMRRVLAEVLNAMHQEAPQEALRAPWTDEALESDLLEGSAVDAVLTARYGERRVAYDPSDQEANKLAVSKGYTVVHGGSHSAAQWESIRGAEALLPAGKVTPSPKAWSTDPDAEHAEYLTEDQQTRGMRRIARFAELLAEQLKIGRVHVEFTTSPVPWAAAFGGGILTFSVKRLGKAWFGQPLTYESVLRLIVHEFGHAFSGDHLSEDYHDGLCRLAARLAVIDVHAVAEEAHLAAEG
jgi:hypothetical protein